MNHMITLESTEFSFFFSIALSYRIRHFFIRRRNSTFLNHFVTHSQPSYHFDNTSYNSSSFGIWKTDVLDIPRDNSKYTF